MKSNNIIPILMYHDVSNKKNNHSTYYENFFKQINFIKKLGYQSVNLCDLNKRSNKKKFVITFDDGYENIYKYAFPFLKKNNLKATCFIVTKSIGKFNYWDKTKPHLKKKIMTLRQLKLWIEAGLEIGSHTSNHYNLCTIKVKKMTSEIIEPINFFRKMDINIKTFSYPFGKYNSEALKIVKKHYKFAVTTNRSRYKINNFKRNILPRIPINYDTSLFKLFLKISTIYEDIKYNK